MIASFYSELKTLQRCRCGPLGQHGDGFAKLLVERGYSRLSGQDKMRMVVQLNQWLAARKLSLHQLDDRQIRAFQADRRKRLSSHPGENGTPALLLRMLRETHLIPAAPEKTSHGPIDLLIRDYAQFLIQERGLSQTTLSHRLPIVRQFLSQRFRSAKVRLKRSSSSCEAASEGASVDEGMMPYCCC